MINNSNSMLPRVEIVVSERDDSHLYKFYQDWIALTQMRDNVQTFPEESKFDFLPNFKFFGLQMKPNPDVWENPLTFNFVCDRWEEVKP